MNLLSADAVVKDFRGHRALNKVSIEVPRGKPWPGGDQGGSGVQGRLPPVPPADALARSAMLFSRRVREGSGTWASAS